MFSRSGFGRFRLKRPQMLGQPSNFRLKIKIREQFSILVAMTAVTAVGVLSLIFWVNNRRLIQSVSSDRLSMTVAMKSAQMGQAFSILQNVAYGIATRSIVRNSLRRYERNGNNTDENWKEVIEDLQTAASSEVGGFHEILQVTLFDVDLTNGIQYPNVPNGTVIDGVMVGNITYNGFLNNGSRVNIGDGGKAGPLGLLNITGENARDIYLPPSEANGWASGPMLIPNQNTSVGAEFWREVNYNYSAGRPIHDGFPRELYPSVELNKPRNLRGNISKIFSRSYIENYGGLLLGPLLINSTVALISWTYPIYDQNSGDPNDLLGFSTIVLNASSLLDIINDTRGMGETGQTVLVGPDWVNGIWNDTRISDNKINRTLAGQEPPDSPAYVDERNTSLKTQVGGYEFMYLLPPKNSPGLSGKRMPLKDYPAVLDMYASRVKDGASDLDAENSEGKEVGVAYALPNMHRPLADWGLLIEQSKAEAFEPVTKLEKLLLATVFGTFAVVMLIVWPIAHLSVRPIVRLKAATEKTTRKFKSHEMDETGSQPPPEDTDMDGAEKGRVSMYSLRKRFARMRGHSHDDGDHHDSREFRIPRKVPDRKHIIHDELTDLTKTFNEMAEELELQYSTLEDRVCARTQELNEQKSFAEEQKALAEEQKKIAETANEAKSMFIANISHELRTPLNAIINMCDVAMDQAEAHEIMDVKQSLEIAAKSGKSLLLLITDLLTFSKNQVETLAGRVDEEEFSVEAIEGQLLAVFGQVAEERGLRFTVEKSRPDLAEWIFKGDVKRINRCLLNLVGNGLKFTPRNGFVKLEMNLGKFPQQFPQPSLAAHDTNKNYPPIPLSRVDSQETIVLGPDAKQLSMALAEIENPTIPSELKGHYLQFVITDSGPGIPSRLQKKVFEPFVQAEMSLSKQHDGVGLGLSIVRQIVKKLGGTIRLESGDPIKGSRFTVEVPVGCKGLRDPPQPPAPIRFPTPPICDVPPKPGSKVPPTPASEAPSTPRSEIPPPVPTEVWSKDNKPTLQGKINRPTRLEDESQLAAMRDFKILVAEDNPTNQKVIVKMLRLQRFANVTLANDGREALTKIKEAMDKGETFGIVLMDIQMPHMDGIECTRTARNLGYTAPIVALTAYADEGNQRQCLDAGMNYFLAKPIEKQHLSQVLQVCTDGLVRLSPETELNIGVPSPPLSMMVPTPLLTPAPECDRLKQLKLPTPPEEVGDGRDLITHPHTQTPSSLKQ